MSRSPDSLQTMPDVAGERPVVAPAPLAWVGMRGVQMPVRYVEAQARCEAAARVDALVDLAAAGQRGIHMSRLYVAVEQSLAESALDPAGLAALARTCLHGQQPASTRALVAVAFDLPVRRVALVSGNAGWKTYPVRLAAEAHAGGVTLEAAVDVLYSSTCPSSAALASQAVQQAARRHFAGAAPTLAELESWLASGLAATPHAQRSRARVRARLAGVPADFSLVGLIDAVESSLRTVVQTAVKREDEQAFARLNAENLMFCEDAARRVRHALDGLAALADFRVDVAHYESLHPHDAVASAVKGVAGGYVVDPLA